MLIGHVLHTGKERQRSWRERQVQKEETHQNLVCLEVDGRQDWLGRKVGGIPDRKIHAGWEVIEYSH